MAGVLVFGALVSASPSRADSVVFSNFGAGNTFDINSAWCVSNISDNSVACGMFGVGERFSSSTPFILTGIEIALADDEKPGGTVTVSINTDNGGMPGAVIESWTFSNLPSIYAGTYTPESVNSVLNPLLNANTPYWIVAMPGPGNTNALWNTYGSPAPIHGTFDISNGNWIVEAQTVVGSGAFDIRGTSPVPEPGTLSLLGSGLMGLAAIIKRRVQRYPHAQF